MAKNNDFPESYRDPQYAAIDSATEQKLGLPEGLLSSVRLKGERSNHSQVSEDGATTVYQFIPSTRRAILDKYGIDVALSPQNASEGAGLLLQEGLKRNNGNVAAAVGEFHGGTDRSAWGNRTRAYIQRVVGVQPEKEAQAKPQSTFERAKSMQQDAQPQSTIAAVYDAYKAGKMTPQEASEFEADVKSGAVMLPKGALLNGAEQPGKKPGATMLPQSVTDAYVNGKMTEKEKADLEADMKAGIVTLPPSAQSKIPQGPDWVQPTEQAVLPKPAPGPTVGQAIVGTGEAALNTATGMTGGLVGMWGGTAKGVAQAILDGTFGTPEAARAVEQAAAEGANALTYQPRTESGQEQSQAVGGVMQNLVPVAPIAHTLPPMVTAAKGTPAGVLARAGAEGTARDVVNVLTGDAKVGAAEAPKARAGRSAFASSADHIVDTEDSGKLSVTVGRTPEGGALVRDNNSGHLVEYNPEFASGKTDAELLKYTYEPQGYTGSTPKAPTSPRTAGDVAAAVVGKGIDAAASGAARVAGLAKGATTLPRRALERMTGGDEQTPTAGTRGSAGAAGTDVAAQRKATADQLPVPMGDLLTKGDLTRDPAQQKFEAETAKLPEEGKRLRDRIVAKNQAILDNFDVAIDQTGAQAPTLRAVGQAVDQALVDKAARAKTEIRARYKAAENAGEMEAPVTLQSVVDHLNESAPDAATAPLLTTARARAIQTGLAVEGPDGQLVAQPVSLKRAETFRQAIGAATDYTPTNIRQATIIKGLVDEATQGMGGDLYRQARAARARYAQEFEDHAVIAKLLNNKKGTADRQVALEDVYQHAIQKGSLDDVRTVRKVLQTAGEDGKQAWRELQGQTLKDIRDQATKSVALDSSGNRVLSPAALDKAITALDADGKLDFIFGKKGAQTLRDIREIAQISRTVSPEAAINNSNTAMTLAALADTVFSGMSGMPTPIATTTRMAMKHIKDVRLRNRISDALNEIPKKAPGRRGQVPMHAPSRTIH